MSVAIGWTSSASSSMGELDAFSYFDLFIDCKYMIKKRFSDRHLFRRSSIRCLTLCHAITRDRPTAHAVRHAPQPGEDEETMMKNEKKAEMIELTGAALDAVAG